MAGRAVLEVQTGVLNCPGVGLAGLVAFLANDPAVSSSQLELRALVIESGDRLPAFHRMATGTVRAELAVVAVLMATGASRGESEKGAVVVPALQIRSLRRGNVLSLVALRALEPRVTSEQRIAGVAMVESVPPVGPMNNPVVHAQVLDMAGGAWLFSGLAFHCLGVESPLLDKALTDLRMTVKTLRRRSARTEGVALKALHRIVQELVGAG